MKPTPGPWEAMDRRPEGFSSIEILGGQDRRSRHRHGRAHVCTMRGWTDTPDDTADGVLDDARLIAAAPAMLEAIETAIADLSWDGVPHLDAGEMQHRANQALVALRRAIGGLR